MVGSDIVILAAIKDETRSSPLHTLKEFYVCFTRLRRLQLASIQCKQVFDNYTDERLVCDGRIQERERAKFLRRDYNKTCHEWRMNITETYNGLNIYTHASLQKYFVTLLCVQYEQYCVGHNVILMLCRVPIIRHNYYKH